MKLSVGMRVVDVMKTRWLIVEFSLSRVRIRRLEYLASLDGRGPMEWCVPSAHVNNPPEDWLRANFEQCFSVDT